MSQSLYPTSAAWLVLRYLFCIQAYIIFPIYGYACLVATLVWDVYINRLIANLFWPQRPRFPIPSAYSHPDIERGCEECNTPLLGHYRIRQRYSSGDCTTCELRAVSGPRRWAILFGDLARTSIITGIMLYLTAFGLHLIWELYEYPHDAEVIENILWLVPGTLLVGIELSFLADNDAWAEVMDNSVVGYWLGKIGVRMSVVFGMGCLAVTWPYFKAAEQLFELVLNEDPGDLVLMAR